jgi:hypothetical protein
MALHLSAAPGEMAKPGAKPGQPELRSFSEATAAPASARFATVQRRPEVRWGLILGGVPRQVK